MIHLCPTTTEDYRALAARRLPRFLCDYIDGGAGIEATLAANVADWSRIRLKQRVLVDVSGIDTATTLAGHASALPLALAPVGLAGMMARRGEVQAARAAARIGVPYTLSTVGICGLEEVAAAAPFWFQLYMLRDRGLVAALLDRAQAAGVSTLIFTVDLPMPGPRHRDARNGLGHPGLRPKLLKITQLLTRPRWLLDVGVRGQPHAFGCLGELVKEARDFDAFRAFIETQFDPSVTWRDIEWLRARWPGRLMLKGILDAVDASAVIATGADGLIVSNHGGRQLDGVASTAAALPAIVDAAGAQTEVWVDGGIRSGIDVFRAVAIGARGALIGRPWVWALAAGGQAALEALLASWRREFQLAMALTGVTRVADIGRAQLAFD
jgi:L-lactate dehydrogenase (cytochrome)